MTSALVGEGVRGEGAELLALEPFRWAGKGPSLSLFSPAHESAGADGHDRAPSGLAFMCLLWVQ